MEGDFKKGRPDSRGEFKKPRFGVKNVVYNLGSDKKVTTDKK